MLSLYDVSKVNPGIAMDLSHINVPSKVVSFVGESQLQCAVNGAQVIVITAGMPRKPGMNRSDLFKTNAYIVYHLILGIARYAPFAFIAIITNPVNSILPVASQTMMRCNAFDPARMFGITTLDLVRASTFVGLANGVDPAVQYVPVIGGHAGKTIIPVLSQACPPVCFDGKTGDELVKKIQEAGTDVVRAKGGAGSATLATAFAAARFVNSLLRGASGEKDIIECAYVASTVAPGAHYFATPLLLGPTGAVCNMGMGALNANERGQVTRAIPELITDINQAEEFVAKQIIKGF